MYNLADRFEQFVFITYKNTKSFNNPFRYPNILNTMLELLNEYNLTATPPANLPLDYRGDPRNWNYTWTNFGDYE